MKFDLAAIKARVQAAKAATAAPSLQADPDLVTSQDKFGNTITLNKQQSAFVRLVASGKSCCLIGAAGTGKTTTQRAGIQEMTLHGLLPPFGTHDHRYLPRGDKAPGIAIVAFTRRATNNIRRNLPLDLQDNCITIHKLLEYQPVEVETFDPTTGKTRKTKPFLPTRNENNPFPASLKAIVIEEASMVSTQLYAELIAACPHPVQLIFLGDIQQLPPVFGPAILGFALSSIPVIELTEVYRQALESPILSLAHRILSGNPIRPDEYESLNQPEKGLRLIPWKRKISADNATLMLAKLFIKSLQDGTYNPDTDAILIPFNKSCGTTELNKHIANEIAKQNQEPVYQIIHGRFKSYYSVGDKCLYDREDCIIQKIETNPSYIGLQPVPPSLDQDYWGGANSSAYQEDADIDALLSQFGDHESDDEKSRAASHMVTLYMLDSEKEITIKSAGDFTSLILGYALTVHKSQGSEWDKVFLCFHSSHATMIQRELLYTAVTRAKSQLVIISEFNTFEKGIVNQRLRGNTLAEKADHFKGKYDASEHPTFFD